jgi:hypothetical protein
MAARANATLTADAKDLLFSVDVRRKIVHELISERRVAPVTGGHFCLLL